MVMKESRENSRSFIDQEPTSAAATCHIYVAREGRSSLTCEPTHARSGRCIEYEGRRGHHAPPVMSGSQRSSSVGEDIGSQVRWCIPRSWKPRCADSGVGRVRKGTVRRCNDTPRSGVVPSCGNAVGSAGHFISKDTARDQIPSPVALRHCGKAERYLTLLTYLPSLSVALKSRQSEDASETRTPRPGPHESEMQRQCNLLYHMCACACACSRRDWQMICRRLQDQAQEPGDEGKNKNKKHPSQVSKHVAPAKTPTPPLRAS